MGEGEQEENTINHLKESEDEEEDDVRRVHQVRVLLLGVLYCTELYCTVLLYCTGAGAGAGGAAAAVRPLRGPRQGGGPRV